MSAYTPSFLFDFTVFYAFSGFDNTQLLFIGMIFIITNLYFHVSLSKKHLRYSFPLTLFLLGGMGLRVATSPISFSFIFHYLIFSCLLLVLVIDHRLYLFIPDDYKTPLGKTKTEIEKVSLPSFSSIQAKTSPSKQGISSLFDTFSRSIQDVKQSLTSKLGISSPQPKATSTSPSSQSTPILEKKGHTSDSKIEEDEFIHPVERQADSIPTTKQLLTNLGSQSLDHLDLKIDRTRLEEQSFLDSFFDTSDQPQSITQNSNTSSFSSILNTIDESAVIISRGVVKAVNESFASLIKRPIGDIVGHDFIQFLAPEGFASFKSHCSHRLAGESSQCFPVVLLTKKYEKISLQAQIKTISVQGSPVEITVFQRKDT